MWAPSQRDPAQGVETQRETEVEETEGRGEGRRQEREIEDAGEGVSTVYLPITL